MNIPKYWALHTLVIRYNNKNTKIRRYGWSDIDRTTAQEHALNRCKEAEQKLLTTGNIHFLESTKQYNDIPIHEQVIERYEELNAITSINTYGALCLNINDVIILDIDCWSLEHKFREQYSHNQPRERKTFNIALAVTLAFSILLPIMGYSTFGFKIFLMTFVFAFSVFLCTLFIIDKLNDKSKHEWLVKNGGNYGLLKHYINDFIDEHKEVRFNVYETPLGFRLIALHSYFTADDTFTQACFEKLPVDEFYAKLCIVQDCYRARLTGKPWRMGIQGKPPQNFWQDDDTSDTSSTERQQRAEWLTHYNQVAENYRACKFIGTVGSTEITINEHVAKVIELHDKLSRCHQELPLA